MRATSSAYAPQENSQVPGALDDLLLRGRVKAPTSHGSHLQRPLSPLLLATLQNHSQVDGMRRQAGLSIVASPL